MITDKHRFERIFPVLLAAICSISLFLASSCFRSNQISPEFENTPVEVHTPNFDFSKPLVVSEKADDVALATKIDQILDKSNHKNARWGIFVVSLNDGRVVVAKDAQKMFNPASTQKIITSVAALDMLGADFRWKTSVFAKDEIINGVLDSDLSLYGNGAPDFDEDGIARLIKQLSAKGLRRVKGDIIGDESYFIGDSLGYGWAWNEIQWYYGAQASALSVNKNLVSITLQNRKPKSSSDFVEVSGETNPVENVEAIGLKREVGQNKVFVWGNGNDLDARIAVENPALWAATILRIELEKNGITVEGNARSADWKSEDRLNTDSTKEVAFVESQPLKEIIQQMNKDSVNLYAELILRTLGKNFGETAPDENPKMQKLRGDDLAGAAVLTKWLLGNNISLVKPEIHDGSGLSRLDLITPEAIGRTLVFAAQSKFADEFIDSLPVAGVDGTMRGRSGKYSGKIIAKTGSMQYVSSLAGFASSADETFAFVVFCNNATGTSDSSSVVDAVVESLIR